MFKVIHFVCGYDGTMTLALAVLTDIDVKFLFEHSQLYSFAAVTQTCPENVRPIIRNVCVLVFEFPLFGVVLWASVSFQGFGIGHQLYDHLS